MHGEKLKSPVMAIRNMLVLLPRLRLIILDMNMEISIIQELLLQNIITRKGAISNINYQGAGGYNQIWHETNTGNMTFKGGEAIINWFVLGLIAIKIQKEILILKD